MIDWKTKLTSRKFWMAIIGLVTGVLLAFKVDAQTVETISGVIMAAGSVVAYIIGEGLADAAGAANVPPMLIDSGFLEDDFKKEDVTEDVAEV